jgi:hypothetical protein
MRLCPVVSCEAAQRRGTHRHTAPKTTMRIFQKVTMLAMPKAKQSIMLITPALLLRQSVLSRSSALGRGQVSVSRIEGGRTIGRICLAAVSDCPATHAQGDSLQFRARNSSAIDMLAGLSCGDGAAPAAEVVWCAGPSTRRRRDMGKADGDGLEMRCQRRCRESMFDGRRRRN